MGDRARLGGIIATDGVEGQSRRGGLILPVDQELDWELVLVSGDLRPHNRATQGDSAEGRSFVPYSRRNVRVNSLRVRIRDPQGLAK
jgi:hypothetical protein